MAVVVDSGPVTAERRLHELPQEKWRELVRVRRDYLAIRLSHDCRCLVDFVQDANQMWEPLGYSSPDALIREGYELDPAMVHWAKEGLTKIGSSKPVPLAKAVEMGRLVEATPAAQAGPGAPKGSRNNPRGRAGLAELVAETPAAEVRPRGKRTNDDNVHISSKPKRPSGNSSEARIARLKRDRPDVAQGLAAGKFPSVAAAWRAAGYEKKPDPVKVILKLIAKLSDADHSRLLNEMGLG